jgi:hypothetical protein
MGMASFLTLFKGVFSFISQGEENSVRGDSTLGLVVLCMLLTPSFYACLLGAYWLLFNGWEGLTGMLLTSGGYGLATGTFLATISYVSKVVRRRHLRGMEKDIERVIKTKRPVPPRTATKAVQGIIALVLGSVAFNFFACTLSTMKTLWQTTFLLEAGIWFALGISPFFGNLSHGSPIRGDPDVKLWVTVLMTTATICALLSVLVTYIT